MAYYDHMTMLKLGLGRWRSPAPLRPAPEPPPQPTRGEPPATPALETDPPDP